MGRLIALDTSVIITLAGGQSKHPDGTERAQQLIEAHRDAGDTVIIPAPAFAECCHARHEVVRRRLCHRLGWIPGTHFWGDRKISSRAIEMPGMSLDREELERVVERARAWLEEEAVQDGKPARDP